MYYIEQLIIKNLKQAHQVFFLNFPTLMQLTNRQPVDFFKVFKIFDLKKLDKHGEVKLVQDKNIGRKILAVQGNVSTQNYIVFDTAEITKTQPMLSFSQRYLYIMGYMEVGKNFCFQITVHLNAKVYKFLYSTVYKAQKLTPQGILQMPLDIKSAKWTIIIIDLYQLCEKYSQLDEIRLSFRLSAVQVRANSKIKNMYLSDNLYDPHSVPKDMEFPLKPGQDFYMKYNYVLLGSNHTVKNEIQIKSLLNETKNKEISIIKQKYNHYNHQIEGNPQQSKQSLNSAKKQRSDILEESKQSKHNNNSKSYRNLQRSASKKSLKLNKDSKQMSHLALYQDTNQQVPIANQIPKPKVTIQAKLCAIQGHTISRNGIISLQAFITYPSLFAVHKPIKCLSLHKNSVYKLAVGYIDGSICIWDVIRQKSLSYLKTQLIDLKQIQYLGQGEEQKIFIVGNDKMKRQTILIINKTDILFKQISNYSIHGFLVCPSTSNHLQIIVSYGFENIRLWKLNPHNHIITGVGLYLGKMNRKVVYNSACLIPSQQVALVADSSGYVTKISLEEQKMIEMKKISQNGLDSIISIKQIHKILIIQTGGTIKLLSYDLELLQQFQLGNRIKSLSYLYKNGQLILTLDHYNNSIAHFNLNTTQYRFISRQHNQVITHMKYNNKCNKIITISKDCSIRIWSFISSSYNMGMGQKDKGNNILDNRLQYEIKQQYQFLINNGEIMTALAVDNTVFAYVGFKGGIVRKIDIEKYEIVEEQTFMFKSDQGTRNGILDLVETETVIKNIQISKSSKNVLLCIEEYNSKGMITNMYAILCDSNLNIIYKYNPPSQASGHSKLQILAGFSLTHKKMYICWTYGSINRIQIYSLTQDMGNVCKEFYLQCMPKEIKYKEERVEVDGLMDDGSSIYQVYDEQTGQLKQVINISNAQNSKYPHKIHGPLLITSTPKEQLQISSFHSSFISIKQLIDMPQNVTNLIACQFSQNNPTNSNISYGLILCSGIKSHALYAVTYQVRNMEELYENLKKEQEIMKEKERAREELDQIKQYNEKASKMNNGNWNHQEQEEQLQELQCAENKLIHFTNSYTTEQSQHMPTYNLSHNVSNSRNQTYSQNTPYNTDQNLKKTLPKKPKSNYQNNSSKNLLLNSNIPPQIAEENSFAEQQVGYYTQRMNGQPQQLKRLYEDEEQMYEECKQYIHPQLYLGGEVQQYNNQSYNPNKYMENTYQPKQGVELMYGWHTKYHYNEPYLQHQPLLLIWHPNTQSAVFLSQRNLILHYFKQPVQQKIIRLPAYPSFIIQLGNKYIAVAIGNQIRLYSGELNYIRAFTTIGESVNSLCLSNCEGYIILISSSAKVNKNYIQIVDIVTSSTLCSTYTDFIPSPITVAINPYQQCLQFIIYSTSSLSFYRMTSILTLQTQPLQNIENIINNTDVGDILCAKYLKLKEEQILLLGMSDGSVIVVDSRANNVMMVMRKICQHKIKDILFIEGRKQEDEYQSEIKPMLILITQSNTLYKYTLTQSSLPSLISSLNAKPNSILTTDSEITLHSQIKKIGAEGTGLGMLVMSKFGVLWLLDLVDCQTIKILTVHGYGNNSTSIEKITEDSYTLNNNITKAIIMQSSSSSHNIITGSIDGTVKQTSLFNLQQSHQVYKPRRVVTEILVANGMLIVGFNMEIYFYVIQNEMKENAKKNWKFIGSINLLDMYNTNNKSKVHKYSESTKIIAIKSIPYSDNYIVCTTEKLFILYHQKIFSFQTGKLKLEIKQIVGDLDRVQGLDICGYNQIMVRENGKINVWLRKEKRGENIVEQMSKLEELVYYMMDVYQVNAADASFITANLGTNIRPVNSMNQKQYVLCLAGRPLIQWRDYEQHTLIRELQIGVNCPRIMKIDNNGNYVIGDEEGTIWHVKENGLTLNKIKVFDSSVVGIELIRSGKILIYGANVAIVNL